MCWWISAHGEVKRVKNEVRFLLFSPVEVLDRTPLDGLPRGDWSQRRVLFRSLLGNEPRRRVGLVVLSVRPQQIIRLLIGIKRNGFAISNLASCNSVGWLGRKAFPTRNLITVIKEQRHESHRFDALDSNGVKYHLDK